MGYPRSYRVRVGGEKCVRWVILIAFVLSGMAVADPLVEAQSRFRALDSYQAMLRVREADGEQWLLRYAYRKPGWVRMEFLQPHAGAVLIYDPGTQRVHIWPFGLKRTPALSLDPNNRLIRGPHGYRVDRLDVGQLLEYLLALRERGSLSPLGETDILGRPSSGFEIAGSEAEDRYRVWLARDSLFPLRVERFAARGPLLERVDLTHVHIDVAFPEQFFRP